MNCFFPALKSCRHKNQTKITLFTTLGPPYWMFSRISKVGPNRKLVPSIPRKSFWRVRFRHNPGYNHLFGGLLFPNKYGVRERGCVALMILKVDRFCQSSTQCEQVFKLQPKLSDDWNPMRYNISGSMFNVCDSLRSCSHYFFFFFLSFRFFQPGTMISTTI